MHDKINFIVRFILFAAAHSLFATDRAKKILRGADRRGYRRYYNIASLVMFGWVMSAYRHSEVLYFVPGVWSLIMYLLQVVVAMILVSCLRQTGVGEFLGFAKNRTSSFTNTGWYSIVRHPLYFFSTLFMMLNPVMTMQWLMLTIMGTVYFVIGGLIEERRLAVEFGEAYRHYQQRVPFMIPKSTSRLSRHRENINDHG
ncbi:MAG: isoprenylcysteine carboxylmethyltransferase family protein [Desulfuromonadaceae bacterium]|nr:isoprenylcysteine carboxylmethyltransferase family protein [Desulfuromonadaceae bacterium]